jgi:hypothetical protein
MKKKNVYVHEIWLVSDGDGDFCVLDRKPGETAEALRAKYESPEYGRRYVLVSAEMSKVPAARFKLLSDLDKYIKHEGG